MYWCLGHMEFILIQIARMQSLLIRLMRFGLVSLLMWVLLHYEC